ncbi:hypothetical protein IGI04_043087 [Brassica rapa subsp. trilocularis]|uniref:Uncharacterized protein n=1 Tax=Brassica rapa subsp. trilocularis TaxID=1813537 RepID=A0ABQ7KKA6_BRACM|nr:hypothetical protein IGI04_043087 [Brassica rapa subsp. trilocularis]
MESGSMAQRTPLPDPALGLDPIGRVSLKPNLEGLATGQTLRLYLGLDCQAPNPVGVRQHTQDVRVCLSAHTGCPWLAVCVRQHTQNVCGCPSVHISARWSLDSARWSFRLTVWDVCGCPSAHTGHPWLSVCVCVCPSAHTKRLWLSISTHISTLVLGLSTLALPVDCSGDFGPRGLSIQYTKVVCGCPSAHTRRPGLPVCVRQHTQDIRGFPSVQPPPIPNIKTRCPWTQPAGPPPWDLFWVICAHGWLFCSNTTTRTSGGGRQAHHRTSVRVPWHSTHRTVGIVPGVFCGGPCVSVVVHQHRQAFCLGVSRQHTTGRPCVSVSTHRMSVAGCVCPSAHTGRLWLSISTHISTLVLRLGTLALPVDCLGDFGPRGLFVQYTQDVRGCPPAHTGRLLQSVSKHRTSVAVRVCPCVSVSTHKMSLAVHKYTYQHAGPWTQHGGPSRGLFG